MNGRDASGETVRIFRTVETWLAEGHAAALATVIETWGSAPRRVGAHLAIRDDGLFEGSVSGGCVEGDVVTEAAGVIASGQARRLDYGVADAQAWEVGLACGGRISVFVQPVTAGGFAPPLLRRVITGNAAGATVRLATDIDTGTTIEAQSGDFLRDYPPPKRVMIVGAVHIAQAMLPIAAMLGYTPLIVDPRGSFAAAERFVGIDVDPRWPDEAITAWKPDAATAVVTLSHDPKLDDQALIAALRSPAFYIAALGSRKTQAARRARLAEAGFGEADLARIHGPAGLDIGAGNPAEIALSIAAEMVAAWNGRK